MLGFQIRFRSRRMHRLDRFGRLEVLRPHRGEHESDPQYESLLESIPESRYGNTEPDPSPSQRDKAPKRMNVALHRLEAPPIFGQEEYPVTLRPQVMNARVVGMVFGDGKIVYTQYDLGGTTASCHTRS